MGASIYSLAVSAAGDRFLAGADGHGLFLSTDRGHTWQAAPAMGQSIVAGVWFVAADGRSGDDGRTWQPASGAATANAYDDLGQTSVNALAVSPDGRWLYATTPQGCCRGLAR